MSLENEHRLRFRDAMSSLSAAVNIVTTDGPAGRCGITATAVCSVTDTPPSLMVCINSNSAMNPVFQENGKLCVNVLNHEQELMARHFAGMTGTSMEERFSWDIWTKGVLGQPMLRGTLASLEGKSSRYKPSALIWSIWYKLNKLPSAKPATGLFTLSATFIRSC